MALLTMLAVLVLVVMLLNAVSLHWGPVRRQAQQVLDRERALFLAQGGARLAAERLRNDPDFCGPIERTLGPGVLRVEIKGDRIHSTSSFPDAADRPIVRRVSVRWRRGNGIELNDWLED